MPFRSALGEASGHSCCAGESKSTDLEAVGCSTSGGGGRKELRHLLEGYRAKQRKLTALHETLFTTRCELHKAQAARERAEEARSALQVSSFLLSLYLSQLLHSCI